MNTINADLYDALIAAKAPEEKARAAAQTDLDREQATAKFNVFMWICGVFVAPLLISLTGLSLYTVYETRKDVARIELELKVELAEIKGRLTQMQAESTETKRIVTEIQTTLSS